MISFDQPLNPKDQKTLTACLWDPACLIVEFAVLRQASTPGVQEVIVTGKFRYSLPALSAAEALDLTDRISNFLRQIHSEQESRRPLEKP